VASSSIGASVVDVVEVDVEVEVEVVVVVVSMMSSNAGQPERINTVIASIAARKALFFMIAPFGDYLG
jgi:hypothetical protein